MSEERRHPLQVTADRLSDAAYRYGSRLASDQRDAIGEVVHALQIIVDEDELRRAAIRHNREQHAQPTT